MRDWIPYQPKIVRRSPLRTVLVSAASRLSITAVARVELLRESVLAEADLLSASENDILQLRIALSVLCDLRAHAWEITVDGNDVMIARPDRAFLSQMAHKQSIRDSLLLERDAQLSESSTQMFIRRMETRKKHGNGFFSVFSLMRDGPELSRSLKSARRAPEGAPRTAELRKVINPYIQVVEVGKQCRHTGLDLQDIWRYFRHTWVTPYRSVPGRQVSFLIRDRASENHPVLGIGALASSVVQQTRRDQWIGWDRSAFFRLLEADGYRGWSRWVLDRWHELLDGVYVDDFLAEGIVEASDLVEPSERAVRRLHEVAHDARLAHRLYRQHDQHKKAGNRRPVDWRAQAQTHLFRSKRARRLAALLDARRALTASGFTIPSPERLRTAANTPAGAKALSLIVRLVKASNVGVNMMDIAICGAVDPYRVILGGKLVSLLMASPPVVRAYRHRYQYAPSIIASSMAGRAVARPPTLVLLMTTSLYGVASSQYNRLKVPVEYHGGEGVLEFVELDETLGFGSYHFSKATLNEMAVYLARDTDGRAVNSIFGEGVNPKLRRVRSALDRVGLPSDSILRHGSRRIVYGIPLASNFRDILLARARRPHYGISPWRGDTSGLVNFWYERWLGKRIERDEVLDRVAEHSTVYPVKHGARVPLLHPEPETDSSTVEPSAFP